MSTNRGHKCIVGVSVEEKNEQDCPQFTILTIMCR